MANLIWTNAIGPEDVFKWKDHEYYVKSPAKGKSMYQMIKKYDANGPVEGKVVSEGPTTELAVREYWFSDIALLQLRSSSTNLPLFKVA